MVRLASQVGSIRPSSIPPPQTCSLTESLSSRELYRHGYTEAGDNVYEDVEGVKKMLQEENWRKRKAALKSKSVHSPQLWLQDAL